MQNNKVIVNEIEMMKYVIYNELRKLKPTFNFEQSCKKWIEYP